MTIKLARVGVGFLLFAMLFYFRLIDFDKLRNALAHPWLLVLAIIAAAASIPFAGLRWHILLRSQGLVLHLWHTIRIVAISAFFATFLPGGASGDIIRGVYIYHVSHGRRAGALLSIFIDRLIGLTAFVLFGILGTLIRSPKHYGALEYGTFVAAVLYFAGIAMLFVLGHRSAQFVNHVFTGRSHKLSHVIETAGEALQRYAREWRVMALGLALSAAIALLTATCVVLIADAMQFGGLTPLEYGMAGIYAMIANTLPITPGGLGVGEGAFASICVALEPTNNFIAYGTIFLALRCVIVISTLPGLIIYLVYPHRAQLLMLANPKF